MEDDYFFLIVFPEKINPESTRYFIDLSIRNSNYTESYCLIESDG